MTRRVAVVAHTHWDREWYQPFPEFRRRLVALLDDFLEHLEADPAFDCFLLDGQLALVDDYLAMRPEAESILRRLAAAGRLSIGPWYILMDEFLVSGETIIRNLQLGLERAAAFGGAMRVGYLPDMFGHIAQMPQILRSAGFEHAVVWRGVPAAVDRTGFWWSAPDGSTVRAEYLPVGYSNGAHLPQDVASLRRRLAAEVAAQQPVLGDDTLLLMAGTDHQVPQTWLPRALAELRATAGADLATDGCEAAASGQGLCEATADGQGVDAELTSLSDYLDVAPTEGLPLWTGELRSSARANLLMGVVSNRTDIRAVSARAEQALERLAEPLATLWMPAVRWPQAALDQAWLEMIRNSAHDSICACSHDDVAVTVLHRYGEAEAVAEGIVDAAGEDAALAFGFEGPAALNPGAGPLSGLVEIVQPLQGDHGPVQVRETVRVLETVQVLETVAAGSTTVVGMGRDFARLRGELVAEGWSIEELGHHAEVAVQAAGPADNEGAPAAAMTSAVDVRIELDATRPAEPGYLGGLSEAAALASGAPESPLRITVTRRGWQRVLTRVSEVPGYGWAAVMPGPLDVAPVVVVDDGVDNSLVRVSVDPTDGTFSLNELTGLDRLVESADAGDTYNYSPPSDDIVVDRPDNVTVTVVEQGPLRARLLVARRFRWPECLKAGRRVGEESTTVVTSLEVRAGEALVRVATSFDHRSRDHRLRALFPLPKPTKGSVAECAFGTVERTLVAEGGSSEVGLATYPSRRFVCAGGLTFTHEGVAEYEVVDDGATLAVTLLRATGILSQPAPTLRPNSAGPRLPLEGPQMIGPVHFRYAVAVGEHDPYRLADLAWLPLPVVIGRGTGTLGLRGTHLEMSGAEVSCLRRVAGGIELRVFNPTSDVSEVGLPGRSGWLVNLRGHPLEPFSETFPLRPWGIATVHLGGQS